MGDLSTLGDRIAQLRKERGLSQKQLAEQTEGFNRDHIVKLENNKVKNPNRELLAQLVRILGTTYEWLERGEGKKFAAQDGTESELEVEHAYVLKVIDMIEDAGVDTSLTNILRTEIDRLFRDNLLYKKRLADLLEMLKALRRE